MTTILAVDDNPDDLYLLKRALGVTKPGHQVITACDGVDAQRCLQRIAGAGHPDTPVVVFSDLNMPRCDGLELLAWLKSKPEFRRVPVVMFSSFENPADVNRALELGAAACMRKPPSPDAVKRLVKMFIDTPFEAAPMERTASQCV